MHGKNIAHAYKLKMTTAKLFSEQYFGMIDRNSMHGKIEFRLWQQCGHGKNSQSFNMYFVHQD